MPELQVNARMRGWYSGRCPWFPPRRRQFESGTSLRMSFDKKLVRKRFREAVFTRDNYACRMCNWSRASQLLALDAHHITDRNLMPNGGYCKENGISLCPECHEKAEVFHSTGVSVEGYSPDDLYKKIGSSYDAAVKASERLTQRT